MRDRDRSRRVAPTGSDSAAQAPASRRSSWLGTFRRYALFVTLANLLWESAHVPLYTLWAKGTLTEIAFSVVHCTTGDLMIAFAALGTALGLVGNDRWPAERFGAVASLAAVLGIAYALYSEWLNVTRGAWAYTNAMPIVPLLGTGLSPLLQWLLLPPIGLAWARRTPSGSSPGKA